MNEKDDLLSVINLLAGAAQAGAQGIIAQAALNLMRASEAVVKAQQHNLDKSIQDAALKVLNDAQQTLISASNVKGALEEAKQDLQNSQQQPYKPE